MARKRFGELLLEHNLVTGRQLEAALDYQRRVRPDRPLGETLVGLGLIDEDHVYETLARQMHLSFVDAGTLRDIPARVRNGVSYELARRHQVLPFRTLAEGGRESICLAVSDPTQMRVFAEVEQRSGMLSRLFLAAPSKLRDAIECAYEKVIDVDLEGGPPRPSFLDKTSVLAEDTGEVAIARARVDAVRLEVLAGADQGRIYWARPDKELLIGRGEGVDIVIDDPAVSRHHCKVKHTAAGGVWCVDLGSTNGTLVNETKVLDRRRLSNGDFLQVGQTVLRVAAG